jgi:hypothetical protein
MYTSNNLTADQAAIASKLGSHSLTQAHPKKMVGYQAAIASKLSSYRG